MYMSYTLPKNCPSRLRHACSFTSMHCPLRSWHTCTYTSIHGLKINKYLHVNMLYSWARLLKIVRHIFITYFLCIHVLKYNIKYKYDYAPVPVNSPFTLRVLLGGDWFFHGQTTRPLRACADVWHVSRSGNGNLSSMTVTNCYSFSYFFKKI